MANRRCDQCEYFSTWNENGTLGPCRRYPRIMRQKEADEYPEMARDDWCGEFKARAKKARSIPLSFPAQTADPPYPPPKPAPPKIVVMREDQIHD